MASEAKDIEAHTIPSTVSDTPNIQELKNNDFEQRNVGTLDRRLKSRHIQFLALSGTQVAVRADNTLLTFFRCHWDWSFCWKWSGAVSRWTSVDISLLLDHWF